MEEIEIEIETEIGIESYDPTPEEALQMAVATAENNLNVTFLGTEPTEEEA